MAEQPIKGQQIVEKGALDEHINQLNVVISGYEAIDNQLKTIAKNAKTLASSLSATKAGDIKVAKEQQTALNKALVESERVKRAKIQTEKALIGLQNKKEAQNKRELKQRKDINNVYKQESKQLTDLINRYQNLAARGRENGKVARGMLKEITKLDTKLKAIDSTVGRNFRNVGNYNKAWQGLRSTLIGGLGISTAVIGLKNLGSELLERGNDLRGIEFAFDRLGQRGEAAFNRIKQSTRGLVSDTDIKRSLVEFDNFNISLEQTDTLFEFLAVRAAQTGTSIDKLKDSLVEGLSKESKLRIDNLGISAGELNAELEKTPNFVEAVANIAKREVAEAGDVLDKAGNNQQRWNVVIQNTKDQLARFLIPIFDRLFRILSFVADNFRTISKVLGIGLAAWTSYKLAVKLAAIEMDKVKKNGIIVFLTKMIKGLKGASFSVKGLSTGFRGLGTAIKSIPLAGLISTITTGITTMFAFSDAIFGNTEELDANTEAARLNREELERGQEIINERKEQLSGINTLTKDLNSLTQDDLKLLKQKLETQIGISVEQELELKRKKKEIQESKKLGDLESSFESIKIRNQITAIENQDLVNEGLLLESKLRNTINETEREAISDRLLEINIKTTKDFIDVSKEKEELQKQGIDTTVNETRRLEDLRKKLEAVNALIKDEADNRGSNSRSIKSEAKELTGLDKLRAEQTIKQKQLSDELVISNGLETERAALLREQLEILELQIKRGELVNKTGGLTETPTRGRVESRDGTIKPSEGIKELATETEKAADSIEDSSQVIADISNKITDLLQFNFDRRMDMLNQEEEAERRKADAAVQAQERIIAARNAGVTNAEESLAFEKKAEAEALAEQERIQKRKQRLQLFNAGVQAFNAEVQQGVNNPAGSTIAQLSVLLGFLNSIPGFWTGTETTVGDALGNKVHNGRDGVLARIDTQEMVFNAEKTKKLNESGLHTTDEITRAALLYQNGITDMNRRSVTTIPAYSDPKLYSQLKENNALLKTIAQKPVIDNSAEIVGKVLHFIKKEVGNGKTTTTIHKTRF